jgi:hypothetical protein
VSGIFLQKASIVTPLEQYGCVLVQMAKVFSGDLARGLLHFHVGVTLQQRLSH